MLKKAFLTVVREITTATARLPQISHFSFNSLFYLKLILSYAAEWADIVVGEILECYTRLNSLLGIANLGVIYPLTYCTDILFHNYVILILNNIGETNVRTWFLQNSCYLFLLQI